MIQQVEKLETQLELRTLAKTETPAQARVHIEEPRRSQAVVSGVAEGAQRVSGKGRGSDPDHGVHVLDIRVSHHVGPVLAHARQGVVHAGRGIEGEPCVGGDQRSQLPVPRQLVQDPASEFGGLVNQRRNEVLSQIDIADGRIRVAVIGILVIVGAFGIAVRVRLRILHAVRPGVNGEQREVLVETVLRR